MSVEVHEQMNQQLLKESTVYPRIYQATKLQYTRLSESIRARRITFHV